MVSSRIQGKTWTYNEVDYSIDTSGSVSTKSIVEKDVWNKKSATDKLVRIYPNRKGAVKSDAYTYAVPKGYHAGVGTGATVDNGGKRGSDLYAITWFDIAMGQLLQQFELKSKKLMTVTAPWLVSKLITGSTKLYLH